MPNSVRKAIILGGTGVLGPAAARRLLDAGWAVDLVGRQSLHVPNDMLTPVMFRIPSGLRAWIEDVAVDEAARGQEIGDALSRAAVDHARAHGARTIELTSRPAREVANRLYRKLGFEIRNTNVYRLVL
jgi:ribosomal protein S18 acetylase RimI-like enzyme